MKPLKRPWQKRHLLVCTNARDPATGKPSCGMNGSNALRDTLKKTVKERGLKGTVMVTGTGCLDVCPLEGCTVGFYPEAEFFVSPTGEAGAEALLARLLE
jgi:predicted metal-binding protein